MSCVKWKCCTQTSNWTLYKNVMVIPPINSQRSYVPSGQELNSTTCSSQESLPITWLRERQKNNFMSSAWCIFRLITWEAVTTTVAAERTLESLIIKAHVRWSYSHTKSRTPYKVLAFKVNKGALFSSPLSNPFFLFLLQEWWQLMPVTHEWIN